MSYSSQDLDYNISTALDEDDPHYVYRHADQQIRQAIQEGKFCYVLSSRQMGKTSLLRQTIKYLRSCNIICSHISLLGIGTNLTSKEQWYNSFCSWLFESSQIFDNFDFDQWLLGKQKYTYIDRLRQCIEMLVRQTDKHLVIFIDEIDSIISYSFSLDEIFELISYFSDQKKPGNLYSRISFVVLGVARPQDLVRNPSKTIFPTGEEITLEGFKLNEIKPLSLGLKHKIPKPITAIQIILEWTGGQPLLTNVLCRIIRNHSTSLNSNIQKIIRENFVEEWETKDESRHIQFIERRLLENKDYIFKPINLYLEILKHPQPIAKEREAKEIQLELVLSGIAIYKDNHLQVFNRIYKEIYTRKWAIENLNSQYPTNYLDHREKWESYIQLKSKYPKKEIPSSLDSFLSSKVNGLTHVLEWAEERELSTIDYRFLSSCQELRKEKSEGSISAKATAIVSAIIVISTLIVNFFRATNSHLMLESELRNFNETQQANELTTKLLDLEKKALNSQKNNELELDRLELILNSAKLAKSLSEIIEEYNLNTYSYLNNKAFNLFQNSLYNFFELGRFHGNLANISESKRRFLFTSSDDHSVKIWNADGTLRNTLIGHQAPVNNIDFSSNGKYIVTASDDHSVKIWNADGTLRNTLIGHQAPVKNAQFADEETIITTDDENTKVWIIPEFSFSALTTFLNEEPAHISNAQFDEDNRYVIAVLNQRILNKWDLNGRLITSIQDNKSKIDKAGFFSENQHIVTVSGRIIKIWNKNGALIKTIRAHQSPIINIEVNSISNQFTSLSSDGTVNLWTADGNWIAKIENTNDSIVYTKLSAFGDFLLTSGQNTLQLWNGQHGGRISRQISIDSPIAASRFSDDGYGYITGIYTVTKNNTMITLLARREAVETELTEKTNFREFRGDIDSSAIISVARKERNFFHSHRKEFSSLIKRAVSSQSGDLAFINNNTIEFPEIFASQPKPNKPRHAAKINSAHFSQDGDYIVTTSNDKTAVLWDLEGNSIRSIKSYGSAILDAQISSDLNYILLSTEDTLIIWPVGLQPILEKVCSRIVDRLDHYSKDELSIVELEKEICPKEED